MSSDEPLPPHLEEIGRQLVLAGEQLQRASARRTAWVDRRRAVTHAFTRTRVLILVVAATSVAIAAAVLPAGARATPGGPAFAAPLARLTLVSPLVLVPLSGLRVAVARREHLVIRPAAALSR